MGGKTIEFSIVRDLYLIGDVNDILDDLNMEMAIYIHDVIKKHHQKFSGGDINFDIIFQVDEGYAHKVKAAFKVSLKCIGDGADTQPQLDVIKHYVEHCQV